MIAEGGKDGVVKVYRQDGSQYQQIQEIVLGMRVRALALSSQKLIISGNSNSIYIYEHDGTEYALTQTITINSAGMPDFYVSADFMELSFGDNLSLQTYKDLGGTHSLVDHNIINKAIREIISDQKFYVMIETVDAMLTYYKCPP